MPAYTLNISNMSFHAFHGYYAEERKIGGWFNVNLDLALALSDDSNLKELSSTVNYEEIHRLVSKIMKVPQDLIEGVCKDIYDGVHRSFPEVSKVRVVVEKLNPPLKMVGKTSFIISDF
jgi:7,8-dihydroneopterin aldolase/epimerase/oxygenase